MNVFEEAFKKIGIDREQLPTHSPEKPLISREEIPPDFLAKFKEVIKKMSDDNMSMPFMHITLKKIVNSEGEDVDTGFLENIYSNGLNKNTNGTCFISRDPENKCMEEAPTYFLEHPETFIENLRIIVNTYKHHGVRTNKSLLGFTSKGGSREKDYNYRGQGNPYMFLADATGIDRKRGKDGIEHYQTIEQIKPDKIMGGLDLDDFNVQDTENTLRLANEVLNIMKRYHSSQALN